MRFFLRWLGISTVVVGIAVLAFLAFAPSGMEVSWGEPVGSKILREPYPTLEFVDFVAKVEEGKIVAVSGYRETFCHRLFGIERCHTTWYSPLDVSEGIRYRGESGIAYRVAHLWAVTLPPQFDPETTEGLLSLHGADYFWTGYTKTEHWEIWVMFSSLLVGFFSATVWKIRRN